MAVNRIELEEYKMKKLIAMLLTLAMVLSLAACGAQSTPTQAATEAPVAAETKAPAATEASAAKEIKVGIAAPDVTHGWVAGVAYYAEKYCKENNLDYMITTSKDAASMTTALDDLVAWGATVIVSWPQWTGMETALQNIIDSGKFQITTPEVKIAVAPEYSYMIEARVIDGRRYILIPADDGVEINGIGVNIPNPQSEEA